MPVCIPVVINNIQTYYIIRFSSYTPLVILVWHLASLKVLKLTSHPTSAVLISRIVILCPGTYDVVFPVPAATPNPYAKESGDASMAAVPGGQAGRVMFSLAHCAAQQPHSLRTWGAERTYHFKNFTCALL
jgi:hypothetical protein